MSFATRHNSASLKFNFEIPETHSFIKPNELVDENGIDAVYTVRSMYINNKGKFGDEPVLITDTHLVNAPQHIVDIVKDVLQCPESINDVNDGKVGFKFYTYKNQYGDQYGLAWVDL